MYELAFICMLFLQLIVYSASYYVTQAIILKKLQNDISPLASFSNHAVLLTVSLGSILALFFGFYLPVIVVSIVTVTIGAYLWFSN